MNKYLKNIALVMTIVAGIAAVIGMYTQYKGDNPTIEIKNITRDKLTDLPKVEGLNAEFYYKDSLVNSLWKLNYFISNSGNKTIIGEGNNKNIIKERLVFFLPENYKILELNTEQNTLPFDVYYSHNKVAIKFLQWKPNESFSLTLYVEELSENEIPTLETNEREILNGIVNYTSLQNEVKQKQPIFYYLPRTIQLILRWLGYISFGMIVIVMPIIWINEVVKYIKYKKWVKSDFWMYKDWIDEEVKKGQISFYYKPTELPIQYWKDYPYVKPVLPDNDLVNLTIGGILLLVLAIIPLLVMIEI